MAPSLSNLGRFAQLVRYHRPQQFAWRALRRAQGIWERTVLSGRRSDRAAIGFKSGADRVLVQMAEQRVGLWPSRANPEWLAGIAEGRFCFLGEERGARNGFGKLNAGEEREAISTSSMQASSEDRLTFDWYPAMPQLWRFHLQCHEYLLELAAHRSATEAWSFVESWLSDAGHQHPIAGTDAWHPFCISRRLPVWLMLAASAPPPKSIANAFWNSVAVQSSWLRRHLEWDLGGNHLLENLRALALVTFFVEGVDVASFGWLVARIREQLGEQVLASGEHIERASTYHALMLLAVLEIGAALEFAELPAAKDVFSVGRRMAEWLGGIVHPDAQVPLFGDSTLDETPLPGPLCSAAQVPIVVSGEGATRIGDAWCWRSRSGDFLIVDAGPTACDHLPAHGHADLLTLEASIAGQRTFVDGGVFDYEDSEMRRYCRGTSAHNTLQVDGENHCDVWSRFRMGRRGRPIFSDEGCQPPFCWFAAAHDAYVFLGVPWTGRFVAAAPGPICVIVDWITGDDEHEMVTRLRLHPDVELDNAGDGEVRLVVRRCHGIDDRSGMPHVEQHYRLRLLGDAELKFESGWYCPNFGDRRAIQVVAGRSRGESRQWLAWMLQPIEENGVVDAEFRDGKFNVRLPNGGVVSLPGRQW